MRCRLVVGGLLLMASSAMAITWNFDEDSNRQGWIARESDLSNASGLPMLRSEVHDGIWRVQPLPFEAGRNPAIALVSPIIGRDSALFDRLVMRFRVVHTRPVPGSFMLSWTNSHNQETPGLEPDVLCLDHFPCYTRFSLESDQVYTTEWKEIVVSDLRSRLAPVRGSSEDQKEIIWEGVLTDIWVHLRLTDVYPYIEGPGEVPEAVEIDWITLTGVEEQLGGELTPPAAPNNAPLGEIFAAAVFHPLGVREIGSRSGSQWTGALGDLDGDKDLDLVTPWASEEERGWLLAFNDGKGAFVRPQLESFRVAEPVLPFVGGADLDGDGRMDLVLHPGAGKTEIWFNDEEEGWRVQGIDGFVANQVADFDADGDMDLLGYVWGKGFTVRVLLNDGRGDFSSQLDPEVPGAGYVVIRLLQPVLQGKGLGLLWAPPFDNLKAGYATTYLGEKELRRESLQVETKAMRISHAGDLDLDGDTDLVTNDKVLRFIPNEPFPSLGLNFLRNKGDGRMDTVAAFAGVRFNRELQIMDVDEDSIPDAVVVHNDMRDPAVLVFRGQGDGRFIQDGRYPLEEGRGGPTLSGDLDGNGDRDLVVFDESHFAGGGIHVLLNRTGGRLSVVEESASATPTTNHLGAAYPNPFNPGVVIPFTIGPSSQPVSMTIYNTLGQEVRELELGELPAGAHQVVWDGLGESGVVLSSGAYLYLLQAGAWSASGKMVKSQ